MGGRIRVGIGGWVFPPWRGSFYPEGLRQKDELSYVGRHLSACEINATYYSRQKPATFAGWAGAVPDGFRFAVKASRACTNRRLLAESGEAVDRFLRQGLVELGDRLGPILWQFMPTKAFDPDDFRAFLALLPDRIDGLPLRHALEVRHDSFRDVAFLTMARDAGAAVVFVDHPDHPRIRGADVGFSYARLMATQAEEPTGYAPGAIAHWADMARGWAGTGDSFVFFIGGAKIRAPAAAQALIAALR
ncbi:MAG: DUF72 domain-containing protein [Sphingobium sp.]